MCSGRTKPYPFQAKLVVFKLEICIIHKCTGVTLKIDPTVILIAVANELCAIMKMF